MELVVLLECNSFRRVSPRGHCSHCSVCPSAQRCSRTARNSRPDSSIYGSIIHSTRSMRCIYVHRISRYSRGMSRNFMYVCRWGGLFWSSAPQVNEPGPVRSRTVLLIYKLTSQAVPSSATNRSLVRVQLIDFTRQLVGNCVEIPALTLIHSDF